MSSDIPMNRSKCWSLYTLYIRLVLVGIPPPPFTIYGSCLTLEEMQQDYSEIRRVATCGLIFFPLNESFRS